MNFIYLELEIPEKYVSTTTATNTLDITYTFLTDSEDMTPSPLVLLLDAQQIMKGISTLAANGSEAVDK
jgi:hypothetical protein